ncbi:MULTISPECIES: hypothetical protein [unclassified Bradyrhizobium]|uniref:hypothetical protein n=1 Tax=unclassified Bradyrhizobium TaxID=2631580 RepID=UPI0012EB6C00|nr:MULTISPECIES: hypothetical protein [unclassified Bradyrhizobium]QIG92052.1 hypothetical protein G6P99_05750 [Bradyrhizobium sp. 6(2017)]
MSFAVGEIVGHRYWVVSWGGNLFGPHSWRHWHPEEPMSGGNLSRGGHAGVFALKTKDLVNSFLASASARRELARMWRSPPLLPSADQRSAVALAIGTISMWGTIWEHESGFRAQFGRVRTIDEWLAGDEFEQRQTEGVLLQRLRETYGCASSQVVNS